MATISHYFTILLLPIIKHILKLVMPSLHAPAMASAELGECAVCLSEIGDGEALSKELKCKHVFHKCCLHKWVEHQGRTCPLCRDQLLSHEKKGKAEDEGETAAAAEFRRWRGEAAIVFSPFSGFSSEDNWWLR